MKILVLGKNGMLGSCFMKLLADKNFDLHGFARDDFDFTDFDKLTEVLEDLLPDFIVNAAAYTAVDDCETNKELALKVNAELAKVLAKFSSKNNVKLVHFSTDYVFDGKNKNGYSENAETQAINVYGETKALGEKAIQNNMDEFYIVRTSWLFGENGKNFVDTMLNLAKDHKELNIVGDQIASPTYTYDLAKTVIDELIIKEPAFGVYHITNSDSCSWFDFAKKIFEISNLDIKLNKVSSEEFKRPAPRPKNSILLNSKLKKIQTWEDALAKYLDI